MKPWYESPVMPALIGLAGVLIGASISFLTTWLFRWRDRRERAESVMLAFRGEISTIRSTLRADLNASLRQPSLVGFRPAYKIAYPRTIYETHASFIGDLRDGVLVRQIAHLYSILQRVELVAASRHIDPDENFLRMLGACLDLSVLLDMRLARQTEHLADEDFTVIVSGQDEADRRLASRATRSGEPSPATNQPAETS